MRYLSRLRQIQFVAFLLIFLSSFNIYGQAGVIRGVVTEALSGEGILFATIKVESQKNASSEITGTRSGAGGEFTIENLLPGFYNVTIQCPGFISRTFFEIEVSNTKPALLDVELESLVDTLKQVTVTANPFIQRLESPVSVRSIGVNEIQRYPGGNRDISKVIQSLPGVGFSTGFRNDLIIRGGSPSENRFYLDDIEIPNINHFATQGGTGGPVGLINVDFIKDVSFYSSAFPAHRGNMLSSLMDIKLRDGRIDRWGIGLTLGITESALSVEGPLNDKKTATFLGSVRGSYYNWFFRLIELPIFPNYNDTQLKIKYKLSPKDQITFLTLVACDIFKFNLSADNTEESRYVLRTTPVNNQWSYTAGIKYTHSFANSNLQFILSRNELINRIYNAPIPKIIY